MSIFGALIPSSAVEQAVLALAAQWTDTYLAEVERQQGMSVPTLERPRSQQTSYDFENWPEGQLPALVCVCPGTTGELERSGVGQYGGWFALSVGVLVEDTTEANARRVSQLHQAALDGLLVQHGSLGGFASDLYLTARASRLPDIDNRTLAYAESSYRVFVDQIVARSGGPPTADPPSLTPEVPWPGLPVVGETEVTFTGE